MAKEIERKFLVDRRRWTPPREGVTIKQGFIPTAGLTVVRIRISADQAFLTIKGKSVGCARSEFEYAIPVVDAEQMLQELCEQPFIDKTRYRVDHAGRTWEVDVFHGDNEGLVLAEIELDSAAQAIDLPPWVAREVTDDHRYQNVNLARQPYRQWRE